MKSQLEHCFSIHSQRLLRFAIKMAYRYHLPIEAAEDAVQECYVKFQEVFASGKRHLIADSVYGWLSKTLRNHLINVKKSKIQQSLSLDHTLKYILEPVCSYTYNPQQELEQSEMREKVQEWLKTLSPERAEVVYLRVYENFSITETAQILNIEEGTVKSRLSRAIENLKLYMQDRSDHAASSVSA